MGISTAITQAYGSRSKISLKPWQTCIQAACLDPGFSGRRTTTHAPRQPSTQLRSAAVTSMAPEQSYGA